MRNRAIRSAIAIMCLAQVANVTMYAAAKWVGGRGIPSVEIVAFRFAFTALGALGYAWFRYGFSIPKPTRLRMHGLRNILLLGSTGFGYAAVGHMHLADVQAVLYLSPLITTCAALLFLHERLRPRVMPGIVASLVGVLVVLQPASATAWPNVSPGSLYALASATCSAGYAVATRALGREEPAAVTLLLSAMMTSLAAGLAAAVSAPVLPDRPTLAVLAGIGLIGLLHQLGLVVAHQRAEANQLAPFVYLQLPFALLVGLTVFGETIGIRETTGIAFILSVGLWVAAARQQQPAYSSASARCRITSDNTDALAADVAESDADPRTVPYDQVRARLLRPGAGEFDPEPR